MTVFVVKARSKKQEEKIRAALELVDADFIEDKDSESYLFSAALQKDIDDARKEMKEGKTTVIDPHHLWKSIGS